VIFMSASSQSSFSPVTESVRQGQGIPRIKNTLLARIAYTTWMKRFPESETSFPVWEKLHPFAQAQWVAVAIAVGDAIEKFYPPKQLDMVGRSLIEVSPDATEAKV